MKQSLASIKKIKIEEKCKKEGQLDINCNLDTDIENKANYMNSDNYPSLFDGSDREDEELNKGFKRLVRRKRSARNVSDSSSMSSPSSMDSARKSNFSDSENSSQDGEIIEEKETKKLRELMQREDDALSFCLDISLKMKKGIVDFFVGSNAEEDAKSQITDNIKNGHCNISSLTDELRKGEIFEYINSFGDTRLKEYQIVGVSWLLALHQNSYNGILADEMGLGKTAQTCVWLQYLFDSDKLLRPVIISCPASLLDNWTKEISIWAPRLRAIKYHGSQKERRQIADQLFEDYEENKVDAIITTFQMLSNKMDINMAFKHFEFSYMIVDEAHNIKNSASQRYKSMSKKIQSERKLLLTGTPISNSISELTNMLIFLMPEVFNSDLLEDAYNSYKRQISKRENYKDNNSEVLFLQQIIAPFVLRRSKQDVLSCLPKKHTFIEFCELTKVQKKQYNDEIGYIYMEKDSFNDPKDNMLEKTFKQDSSNEKKLINLIQRKIQDKVNRHFGDSTYENDKECEDSIDSNDIIVVCKDNDLELEENEQVKSQESAKHHYDPKYVNSIIFRMRRICNHALLHQGHYTNKQIEELVDYLSENVEEFREYPRIKVEQHITQLCDYEIHQLVGRLLTMKNSPVLQRFKIEDDLIINGSCKLMKMNEIIQSTVIGNKEKCLVFCHHTMLLDIIEEYIKIKYNIPNFYLRLDGTTPILERQNMIEKFQNTEVPLFLLSTKAAGQDRETSRGQSSQNWPK
ncbi:SWI SNF-matrix actin-dependent regulator of chromatin subfamily protein [Cryptosporidium ubiquitum]|uniref:SWI SNF-matrix actin-dependent regulator of chromatin subfamily protein n=1 Tax=Cryptosporidium ubiquitum TaxID=857276 RepID=A0A1J4MK26_9CRYT|nr:SWI SNF-matrix actin-dependent regulator of chromatin subfamily protein [Cryptosporidium ubiquitum]OII74576.1 SWI SNF-matrix actin-dependent regulator of chromatin subfamily protein [Cryptosporidium ubiquitum]